MIEEAYIRHVPWSAEAEQSVLGGLFCDNSAWDRVGDLLSAESFFDRRHQYVFEAIGSLVNANKPADIVTVFDVLKARKRAEDVGGLAYLNQLSQCVPSATNARRYAEIVHEKAASRALITATDQAATIAIGEGDAAPKADRIVALFDQLQRSQAKQDPQAASSLMAARIDHYSAMADGTIPPGAPTGLIDLDAALNGGLQDGRVYVIAARPSIGKSALALQIGLNRAKAGDGVLVLTQEMPAEECIDRCVANLGAVNYGRMQNGTMQDGDWAGLTEAAEAIHRMPLWIDDQPGLTLGDIRAKAFALRRDGLRLLVIDYLQLCTSTNRGGNRNNDLEEISRGIKILAKQLRIPVLLLSQLSREVEKRASPEPNLSDLRDSGAIEQDADAVLFLWFVRQFSDRKVMGLGIAKNRQGERGVRIPLEFQGQYQRWHSSAADISPQQKRTGGFE